MWVRVLLFALLLTLGGCQPFGVIKIGYCVVLGPQTVSQDVVRAVEAACRS